MPRDASSVLPAKVMVRFPGRKCDGTIDQTVPNYYNKTTNLSDLLSDLGDPLLSDQPLASFTGSPGVKVFHETAFGLFTPGGGDPTNKTALDDIARLISLDFYRFLLTQFDLVFRGVLEPLPTALYDEIVWNYRAENVTTRLRSAMYRDQPEELLHSDGLNEKDCKDADPFNANHLADRKPCLEYYGPPGKCVSSKPNLTRYSLCIVDGRLQSTFVSTDVIQ